MFEDNAEHGLGLYLGQKTVRENLIKRIAEVAGSDKASAELKAAFDEFMATKNNTKANDAPAKALIAELEKAAAAGWWQGCHYCNYPYTVWFCKCYYF